MFLFVAQFIFFFSHIFRIVVDGRRNRCPEFELLSHVKEILGVFGEQ